MNKIIKSIITGLLSVLLVACGSNAAGTAEVVKEEKDLSGVYSLIGATSNEIAMSGMQIHTYGSNIELHFNSDNTGVYLTDDDARGFTYDANGHITEDTGEANTEEEHILDFAVQGEYIFLLQRSHAGGYEGTMVFKRTAD